MVAINKKKGPLLSEYFIVYLEPVLIVINWNLKMWSLEVFETSLNFTAEKVYEPCVSLQGGRFNVM